MVTPDIPRSEWRKHPRFAEQALLLESHAAFRGRSAWIIERLRNLAPRGASDARRRVRWVERMRVDFSYWRRSLGAHERYEERKLYPYLHARYGLDLDPLKRGHQELDEHAGRVEQAFAAARADDGRERSLLSLLPLSELIQAVESHRDVLFGHLELEEDRVIPCLLDMPADEYRRFLETPIDKLLADARLFAATATREDAPP